jgi:polyisoprenoid-binding protein YceI
MRRLLMACATVALAGGCSPSDGAAQKTEQAAEAPPPEAYVGDAPSGDYTLDKAHGSLIFRVSHIGFSHYTAQFMDFDASLHLDAANPAASSVTATIDPMSLMISTPPDGFLNLLLGDKWLEAAKFPQMIFRSTRIEMTGAKSARLTGDLSLRGVTKPVTLDVTFNGGYAGHPYEPRARIGFSAHGSLKRTDFGVSEGVPAPGSTIGVSDAVEIIIEAEFNGPPLKTPPPAP